MPDAVRYGLYAVGVVTVLYLIIKYIIPLLLRIIAGTVSILAELFLVVLIIFGVLWVIGYVSRASRQ